MRGKKFEIFFLFVSINICRFSFYTNKRFCAKTFKMTFDKRNKRKKMKKIFFYKSDSHFSLRFLWVDLKMKKHIWMYGGVGGQDIK